MKTRFGDIQIASNESFSHHPNGFGISPYLQEKLVFLGQFEVYQQAAQLTQTMLGVPICPSQIDRLTQHYGAAIEVDLAQAAQPKQSTMEPSAVIYAQADGAMLLTDIGYKEAKLGRIFPAHRTVMQRRLKRSGQRWSILGAQRVLNLRVCSMSDRWNLVRQQIEPYNYAMGA